MNTQSLPLQPTVRKTLSRSHTSPHRGSRALSSTARESTQQKARTTAHTRTARTPCAASVRTAPHAHTPRTPPRVRHRTPCAYASRCTHAADPSSTCSTKELRDTRAHLLHTAWMLRALKNECSEVSACRAPAPALATHNLTRVPHLCHRLVEGAATVQCRAAQRRAVVNVHLASVNVRRRACEAVTLGANSSRALRAAPRHRRRL